MWWAEHQNLSVMWKCDSISFLECTLLHVWHLLAFPNFHSFFTHDDFFIKVFFSDFLYNTQLPQTFFIKPPNYIFISKCLHSFTKSIINICNFVFITASYMFYIFLGIYYIKIIYINFLNRLHIWDVLKCFLI